MREGRAAPNTAVLVIQRRLPHYRVAFFDALRQALQERGFTLNVAVGDALPTEHSRADAGHLPWAVHAPCIYALDGKLCWQKALPWVKQADLVVLTQENKLLLNWWMLAWRRRRPRVALWGHGRDFQTRSRWGGLAQGLKAWLSGRADWWFAYTAVSAQTVKSFGFPAHRITTLNNAVDTRTLQQEVQALQHGADALALRKELGLGAGPIGLYLGSLYPDKKVDQLLEAARLVQASIPAFELVVAGAGPDQQRLQQAATGCDWIHFVGQVNGTKKTKLLTSATLMLCPGAVGLGLVESFASGLPMVVGDSGNHGPEIAYLEPGHNGLLVDPKPATLAQATVALINDSAQLERLRQGCALAASRYTQEAMVQRFCEGVQRWHEASGAFKRIAAT
jgi:glycosyltransferase involved in cell wall biosynthesis